MATINDYYAEPWSGWDLNLRNWWVPTIIVEFMQRSYLSQMVPVRVDPSTLGTKKMIWTGVYTLEPNWNEIDDVSWWLEKMYPAGWQQEIEMKSYGSGMGLHKYHPLVTFWKMGGGQNALRQITKSFVADAMVRQIEQQVLNAYVQKSAFYVVGHNRTEGVAALTATDTYDLEYGARANVDFEYMHLVSQGQIPTQAAFLSPGQAHAIRTSSSDWIDLQKYTEFGLRRVLNWELGAYRGIGRFLRHPVNTLYNHGTLVVNAPVTGSISPGDGAPDPNSETIDGVRYVGQKDSGTRYIQLSAPESTSTWNWDVPNDQAAGNMSLFQAGDIITIAAEQNAGTVLPFNVQYGPHPSDGTITHRQIVSVDETNHRLVLDRPVQKPFTTILEGTTDGVDAVYAYVSKGLHVHAAIHVSRPGAVVGAFADPPALMFPAPFDDRMAQYRVTWDGVYEYQMFRPEYYHIVFSAGVVSFRGEMRLGNETS